MTPSLDRNGSRVSDSSAESVPGGGETSTGPPRTTYGLLRWGWRELAAAPEFAAPFALTAVALTVAQAGIAATPTGGAVPRFAPWVWPVYLVAFLSACIGLGGIFLAAADLHAGIERSHARRLVVAAERVPDMLATGLVGSIPVLGGLLALVLPGLYFLFKFALALPACVVDDAGVAASLRRSFVTTGGRLTVIVGLASTFLGITVVVSVVVTAAFARPGHRGFVGPFLHNLVTAVLVPWFGLAFGHLYADQ